MSLEEAVGGRTLEERDCCMLVKSSTKQGLVKFCRHKEDRILWPASWLGFLVCRSLWNVYRCQGKVNLAMWKVSSFGERKLDFVFLILSNGRTYDLSGPLAMSLEQRVAHLRLTRRVFKTPPPQNLLCSRLSFLDSRYHRRGGPVPHLRATTLQSSHRQLGLSDSPVCRLVTNSMLSNPAWITSGFLKNLQLSKLK